MKKITLVGIAALMALICSGQTAFAADYNFTTKSPNDFYKSTLYEDLYGSEYNYGGPNAIDFTDTSALLPGLPSASTYKQVPEVQGAAVPFYDVQTAWPETYPGFALAAHTAISDLIQSDGSIGTVSIPSLSISVKAYEGTGSSSLSKGVGHFPDSSAWDGNVCFAGHNRGAKFNIGVIKNMKSGDLIRYTTAFGTRTYSVTFVGTISNTDWSYTAGTQDNRITLITCLADQPSLRVCVQGKEI